MHVHHQGRSTYTLIIPSAVPGTPPRVEYVTMGTDATKGEKRQLLVGTGIWKMSRIPQEDLNDAAVGGEAEQERTGCLISEVVTPGFVWEDHRFMTAADLEGLFGNAEGGDETISELKKYLAVGT